MSVHNLLVAHDIRVDAPRTQGEREGMARVGACNACDDLRRYLGDLPPLTERSSDE